MIANAHGLPECPIHPGCPIVGGRCSCGEHWDGATTALLQALRLGLLASEPFAIHLLQTEDPAAALLDELAPFTRNGDSSDTQLDRLAARLPEAVAELRTRQATGAPLPTLTITDLEASHRTAAWMNQPGRLPHLTINTDLEDVVMLQYKGDSVFRILTPDQEHAFRKHGRGGNEF